MRAPQYEYAIGSAHNLPLGSLTNVETILDANGIPLLAPQSFGSYLPGQPAGRGNGIEYQRGYESLEWNWTGNGNEGLISYSGALTIRDTILDGNWSGTCSIYSRSDDHAEYKLYNAVATVRKLPESRANFKALNTFGIKFTRLVERDE